MSLLREPVLAALVALTLAVPLVGFETVAEEGGLAIRTRWSWVAIAVAIVFGGRLVLVLLRILVLLRMVQQTRAKIQIPKNVGKFVQSWAGYLGPIGVVFAALLPFSPYTDRYPNDQYSIKF